MGWGTLDWGFPKRPHTASSSGLFAYVVLCSQTRQWAPKLLWCLIFKAPAEFFALLPRRIRTSSFNTTQASALHVILLSWDGSHSSVWVLLILTCQGAEMWFLIYYHFQKVKVEWQCFACVFVCIVSKMCDLRNPKTALKQPILHISS